MKKALTAHLNLEVERWEQVLMLEKENEKIMETFVDSAKGDRRGPRMNYYDDRTNAKTMVPTLVIKPAAKTARASPQLYNILEGINCERSVTASQIEIHLSFVPPKNAHSTCLQESAERDEMAVLRERKENIIYQESLKHPSKCVKKLDYVISKPRKAIITTNSESTIPKLRKVKKMKQHEGTMEKLKKAKNVKQNKATILRKKTGKFWNPGKNSNSYEMTPPRSAHKSYDICDINTDDDDSCETSTHKPIPEWAHGIKLKNSIIQQHHNSNSMEIFGDCIDMPDLAEMFGVPLDRNKCYQPSRSTICSTPEKFS